MWRELRDWIEGGYAAAPGRDALESTLRWAYGEGLRRADAVFARTLRALDGLVLPEGTAVLVLSDHGEAFGEHGALSHGQFLYDELTRVPLLLRAPGRCAPGIVPGSCGLVDVFPTVLELVGQPVSQPLDGRSLLPLARGLEGGHPVLAQERRAPRRGEAGPYITVSSIRTERAKWIATRDAALKILHEDLYDLSADPQELLPERVDGVDEFGEAFCATVQFVRQYPRSTTKPGTPISLALCARR